MFASGLKKPSVVVADVPFSKERCSTIARGVGSSTTKRPLSRTAPAVTAWPRFVHSDFTPKRPRTVSDVYTSDPYFSKEAKARAIPPVSGPFRCEMPPEAAGDWTTVPPSLKLAARPTATPTRGLFHK